MGKWALSISGHRFGGWAFLCAAGQIWGEATLLTPHRALGSSEHLGTWIRLLGDLGPRSCKEPGVRWTRTLLSAASSCQGVRAEDSVPILLAVTPLEVTIPPELFTNVRPTKTHNRSRNDVLRCHPKVWELRRSPALSPAQVQSQGSTCSCQLAANP